MPHERSGRAATPKGDQSSPKGEEGSPGSMVTREAKPATTRQSKKINWDKVRVVNQPVLRLPYKLAKYSGAKRGVGYYPPELWVQAAIESGLAVMEPPPEGAPKGGWFEIIDKKTFQPLRPGELQELINEGIKNNLRALQHIDFDLPPGTPQDWEAKAKAAEEAEAAGVDDAGGEKHAKGL